MPAVEGVVLAASMRFVRYRPQDVQRDPGQLVASELLVDPAVDVREYGREYDQIADQKAGSDMDQDHCRLRLPRVGKVDEIRKFALIANLVRGPFRSTRSGLASGNSGEDLYVSLKYAFRVVQDCCGRLVHHSADLTV